MKNNTDKIIEITDNSRDYMQALYLDYVNNFLTIQGFAAHYDLAEHEAETLVLVGKRVHSERTETKG